MAKKLKKKRAKKYKPAEERPAIHHYSAETEAKADTRKRLKRKVLAYFILLLPVVLLLLLIL